MPYLVHYPKRLDSKTYRKFMLPLREILLLIPMLSSKGDRPLKVSCLYFRVTRVISVFLILQKRNFTIPTEQFV